MTTHHFILVPGYLTLADIALLQANTIPIELDPQAYLVVEQAAQTVQCIIQKDKPVYGINTGFGALANTRIQNGDLVLLQEKLLLSHAAGVGDLLANEIVKLILLLKINSLARGFSGVRREVIEGLIAFYNHGIYPHIPMKGSVGASGDLAPLAHLSLALLGMGNVTWQGKPYTAREVLNQIKLKPLQLAPKEGLALINGTQVSCALAIQACLTLEQLFGVALLAGALSVDAIAGSDTPFDERVHALRGQPGQIVVAKRLRALLQGSAIRKSHIDCTRVQDPYCIRCQPQVMGACLEQVWHAQATLACEANAVTDNPLVFAQDQQILSAGNFHAEPVALAADNMAIVIAEIGNLCERRSALLIDPYLSQLPPFLVKDSGLNSGFMMAQVTAAALASENRGLAHPASVDNIPTCANQEDHVSMSAWAARRLLEMNKNLAGIVAIELLSACQGVELRAPLTTSPKLQKVLQQVRSHVAYYDQDRYMADDIAKIQQLILHTPLEEWVKDS